MIINGDCLEEIKKMGDNSVDSVVTDPPYELGFMGKKWDASGIAYNVDLWKECLRVLKPGGHLLAFGGTRTYHRMAVAIEDAGFEIRDMLEWIYASGFSKGNTWNKGKKRTSERLNKENDLMVANGYEGWGNSGIKPAHEPIAFCRKPIEKGLTVAQNMLKHGTGAIDIDSCRIPIGNDKPTTRPLGRSAYQKGSGIVNGGVAGTREVESEFGGGHEQGRFPANIICTDDALNDGVMTKSNGDYSRFVNNQKKRKELGYGFGEKLTTMVGPNDSGSKSRYFNIDVWGEKHGLLQFPKASKAERNAGMEGYVLKNNVSDDIVKEIKNLLSI